MGGKVGTRKYSCGVTGTWGSCAWENCRPPWTKAPGRSWDWLGHHRLTSQEVSALVYFPVAQSSLRVNESGEVREEWETLQPLPPHGAQRKKISSLWLENQTRVKRLHSNPQKKKLSHELYHSLWQRFICWAHRGLVWGGNMWHPNAAICLLQKGACKLFHLGSFRGLPLIVAEQRLNIRPPWCVACSSGGERQMTRAKQLPENQTFCLHL